MKWRSGADAGPATVAERVRRRLHSVRPPSRPRDDRAVAIDQRHAHRRSRRRPIRRRRQVACRARSLRDGRRPPCRRPHPARRRAGRRRPRRQPRHRVPRGRRPAGRSARRDHARRHPAGGRAPPGRRGRRCLRAVVRHGLHRGRVRRRRRPGPGRTDRRRDAPRRGRWPRPPRPVPAGRQDDPGHARAGGDGLRGSDRGEARSPAPRGGPRSRPARPGCAPRATSSPGAVSRCASASGRSGIATRARPPASCCCAHWEAGERTSHAPGADRDAGTGESTRIRGCATRGGRPVRPVPAQPAAGLRRVARRPRPVRGARGGAPRRRRPRCRLVRERGRDRARPAGHGRERHGLVGGPAAGARRPRRRPGLGVEPARRPGRSCSPTTRRPSCSACGRPTVGSRTPTASGSPSSRGTSLPSRSMVRACARRSSRNAAS